MNILEEIVQHKKNEVALAKATTAIRELEQSTLFDRSTYSLSNALRNKAEVGIIAEIKRTSPSTKALQENIDVTTLSQAYLSAGASCLSVLTDKKYFGGTKEDLLAARAANTAPILRKDFIVDEYQLIEAKSIGADCILLIAACLSPKETKSLAATAKSLGLEILLEVHEASEINSHINQYIDNIGINNRDLKTFTTDIQTSIDLYPNLPQELCKISESGISTAEHIDKLASCGFDGFLIGGHFMKSGQPAETCKNLIDNYKALQHES